VISSSIRKSLIACKHRPHGVIKASDIDAVAIVTPVSTHYELPGCTGEWKACLCGEALYCHIAAGHKSYRAAERKISRSWLTHTFSLPSGTEDKALIEERELGKIFYYDSIRVNLGLFQHDVNVVWDLALMTSPSCLTL
jgi:hypothetical protein